MKFSLIAIIVGVITVVCILGIVAVSTTYEGSAHESNPSFKSSAGVGVGAMSAATRRVEHPPLFSTNVPSGDVDVHRMFVQYISETESRYLYCNAYRGYNECVYREAFHVDIMKRYLALRVSQKKRLNTIQIGCLDGRSNDPVFQAFVKVHENNEILKRNNKQLHTKYAFSLVDWHGILVEPVSANMEKLRETYKKISKFSNLNLDNMYFVDKVIAEQKYVSKEGTCTFYDVLPVNMNAKCPYRKHTWLKQTSSLDNSSLKLLLKEDFNNCVETKQIPCTTVVKLLTEYGYPLTKVGRTSQYCTDDTTGGDRNAPRREGIDMLLIDTEGNDGSIIRSYFDDLCMFLWPKMIIYEDKVIRNREFDRTRTTIAADSLISYLEDKGYYIQLSGENAVGGFLTVYVQCYVYMCLL